MELGRLRLAPRRRPRRVPFQVGRDQQVRLSHQAQATPLLDQRLLHEGQVRPSSTVAPERVLGLALWDPWAQGGIALGDLERPAPWQPHCTALVLNSTVISPTSGFSLACSRPKRASLWRCCWTSKALSAWARHWSRPW